MHKILRLHHYKIKGLSFNLFSDTVDYQAVYSGGNGEVYALGVVSHSHITVVAYSVEDGEIIKQVIMICCCYIMYNINYSYINYLCIILILIII